jgi:multiple sugar transport system substrate-binding protein
VECLKVGVEPAGDTGKPAPALGGFSLGVNAKVDENRQKAAYLFIQWVTSEEQAKTYINNGGVSGRKAVYDDPQLQQQYPYFAPLVESWEQYGNPVFRPRFPEWPAISETIGQIGSEMQLGRVSVEEGAKRIDDKVREVLKPYYEDSKPKLQ